MLKRLCIIVGSVVALSGCVTKYQEITPQLRQQMLSDLEHGQLTLDCGIGCTLGWIEQLPVLHSLDMSEKWPDLAIGVMRVGYQQDLAYYYLGQAAQGLGFHQAAIKYYKFAGALASGGNPALQCAATESGCQDVDLLAVLPVLIQASEDALYGKKHSAHHASSHKHKSTSKSTGGDKAKDEAPESSKPAATDWVMPPPPTK